MKKKLSVVIILFFFSLSSLAQADHTYWLPGAGINSMSFAPNCSLGQLFVEVIYDTDYNGDIVEQEGLYFRKRTSSGDWQTVEPVKEEWVMDWVTEDAALFYVSRGASSSWEAYALEDDYGDKIITRYLRDATGNWTQTHTSESFAGVASFASAMSTDNTVHFTVLGDNVLRYITFDGATFVTETVTTYSNLTLMSGFDMPHQFRLRNLSMAVDSLGTPHIVYSVDQVSTPVTGGTRQTSKLFYTTKTGNSWPITTLIDPGLSPDDAGLGASIAVAPNGTIAVASAYLPRAGTGSPGVCQLRYLYKTGAGTWISQIVTQLSDGYRSGDGERGTGLYPYLQFDGVSKPHIIFTDHASEHTNTAWSYSGQLRYASRSSATAGTWQLQTVVQQPTTDAFLKRLDYSAIAVSSGNCGNRVAIYTIKDDSTENPYFYHNFSDIFKWISGAEPPPPPPPPENEGKSMPWLFLLLN